MSTTFTADTKISQPKWDLKRETSEVYDWQFQNFAALSLESSLMANCPTKSKYSVLDKTWTYPSNVSKIMLYRDKEKLCGMLVYGNNNPVRKAALQATRSADHPLGVIHLALGCLAPTHTSQRTSLLRSTWKIRFSKLDSSVARNITPKSPRSFRTSRAHFPKKN